MDTPQKYWINVNGSLAPSQEAKISVLDRGFLYGDSVYEVTRVYNGVPLFIEDHWNRLFQSASRIYMELQWSREKITEEVIKTLQASQQTEAYVRVIITRGEGDIGLEPLSTIKQNMVIICKNQKALPQKWYDDGVKLAMTEVVRNAPEAMDPNIKSGNYLNNVLAFRAASLSGAHEAVMLNDKGMVTECTTSNIWMVKNKIVYTPPLKAGLLEGITRKKLLELAEQNKIPIKEKLFTPDELLQADESFITSSTREVLPVSQIDQTKIGDGGIGPMTSKLLKLYRQLKDDYIKNCPL